MNCTTFFVTLNFWVEAVGACKSIYFSRESIRSHVHRCNLVACLIHSWRGICRVHSFKTTFLKPLIYRLVLVERKILKLQIIITTQEEEKYRNIISRYVELYRILKHKNSGVGPCGQIAGSEHINFEGTCGWQRKKSDKGRKCIVLLRKNSYKIIIFLWN